MKKFTYMGKGLMVSTLLIASTITLAAPAKPQISWVKDNHDAPAKFNIEWNMWHGENGNIWHLLEGENIIHTGSLTVNGNTAQKGNFVVNKNSGGKFSYRVKLCDNTVTPASCTLSDAKVITVVGDAINQAPVVNAGANFDIELGTTTNLSGSFTDDNLATPVTAAWSQVSGSGIATFTDVSSTTTQVSFSSIGTYLLRLSVADPEFTGIDDVQINVTEALVNQAPIANAGVDQTTKVEQSISLAASYTDDGKTPAVSQLWAKDSGPGSVAFSDTSAGNSTATFNTAGTYVLSYTVNDSEFSSVDKLTVTVAAAGLPEKPEVPVIAWLSPTLDLANGPADLTLKWNIWGGIKGNKWRLMQNGDVVHSMSLNASGNGGQTDSHTLTISTSGTYALAVSLCNVSGSVESCSASAEIKISTINGPYVEKICAVDADLCLPMRADLVNLAVKGWPASFALGTATDHDPSQNTALADAKINAIVNEQENGARGVLVEPLLALATIKQARAVEVSSGTAIIPTIVVETANAQGSDLAGLDINNYGNLVMHFQNLIRLAATVQVHKDANHTSPASIILNPNLLTQWQAAQGVSFKATFGEAKAWQPIRIKQALKDAITHESGYQISDITGTTHSLNSLYDLAALQLAIDTAIEDNLPGWVQSQNFVIRKFAPDAAFGWVTNVSEPQSVDWVHGNYSGFQALWNSASEQSSAFLNLLSAYRNNAYRPDFLVFDKSASDGFSPTGKQKHAFGAKQWENYLNYVRQVTDYIDTPALLWQIPGGHMATSGENIGNYDVLTQSASAASYFMGDTNIGTNTSAIRSDILSIPLNSTIYNGATNVSELMQQSPTHDWGINRLRHAAYSNVFAILWGGGSATGVVPTINAAGDNNWLKNKVVAYQNNGGIPLYNTADSGTAKPLTTIATLNSDLQSIESVMNNDVFRYEQPDHTWIPSSIYKWADFLTALNSMHNDGVANVKFWLLDPNLNDATNIKYAKVAIAAFLAQSMKETIKFDACDENNWSLNTGEPVNYPAAASCGQLQQVYADYGTSPNGNDNPYSCPRNRKMELTALTHARWHGAPAPMFVAPDAVLEENGLLVNGSVGRWDEQSDCSGKTGNPDLSKQVYLREECKVYVGQKAGKFIWDGSAQKSVEGCGWWGRGVIQTTGRLNFGKLNHFIGRSHVAPEKIGSIIEGVLVKAAPENPLYADMDLCSNPQLVCSTQEHKEIKWIAGLFFWMNEVQGYNNAGGPYASWNYHEQLKAYVDGGFVGTKFIDDVSGIVNRGCPDKTCPVSGAVDGLEDRQKNFALALKTMGITVK